MEETEEKHSAQITYKYEESVARIRKTKENDAYNVADKSLRKSLENPGLRPPRLTKRVDRVKNSIKQLDVATQTKPEKQSHLETLKAINTEI